MVFKVLVTGFGPYGKTKINPSLSVIRNLADECNENGILIIDNCGNNIYRDDNKDEGNNTGVVKVQIITKQVTCEFNKCIHETKSFVSKFTPDAIIMIGEYPGRSMVTLERVAINYNDLTRYGLSDEAGYAPQGTPSVTGGPAAYFSSLPLRRIVKNLRAAGVPADISGDAGTLLCNHLMYGILHYLQQEHQNVSSILPAGFVHLPALPEMASREENLGMPSMTADLSTRAVRCIIFSIFQQEMIRHQAPGGGDKQDIDEPIKSRLLV
ncbi:peptidase C15, pyroglutamyl peptidase I-like protein [Fragilariopsis cylindrus CCMP1102]|uniref:Pyroglutamyl-peptidase I n=1 Tax=Fragilariopsis cylindrus CCMP1102 TaxID=635003 RepID=A0A1E7F0L1_9STRA|nr:peptidase C15, pyroglutamyl peptidase I-like protein [Fragilariopsis cylindrus CCMP1102]|eukprot:OEU11649.1 peptidase C15, pyroglutamyl peptidase I-like protein [Fragilariopsis cylindrus CCMP1102]